MKSMYEASYYMVNILLYMHAIIIIIVKADRDKLMKPVSPINFACIFIHAVTIDFLF